MCNSAPRLPLRPCVRVSIFSRRGMPKERRAFNAIGRGSVGDASLGELLALVAAGAALAAAVCDALPHISSRNDSRVSTRPACRRLSLALALQGHGIRQPLCDECAEGGAAVQRRQARRHHCGRFQVVQGALSSLAGPDPEVEQYFSTGWARGRASGTGTFKCG